MPTPKIAAGLTPNQVKQAKRQSKIEARAFALKSMAMPPSQRPISQRQMTDGGYMLKQKKK